MCYGKPVAGKIISTLIGNRSQILAVFINELFINRKYFLITDIETITNKVATVAKFNTTPEMNLPFLQTKLGNI